MDTLQEAVAEAKAVRESAIKVAKQALLEAFSPKINSMISQKIMSELEDEESGEEMDQEFDQVEETLEPSGIGAANNAQPSKSASQSTTEDEDPSHVEDLSGDEQLPDGSVEDAAGGKPGGEVRGNIHEDEDPEFEDELEDEEGEEDFEDLEEIIKELESEYEDEDSLEFGDEEEDFEESFQLESDDNDEDDELEVEFDDDMELDSEDLPEDDIELDLGDEFEDEEDEEGDMSLENASLKRKIIALESELAKHRKVVEYQSNQLKEINTLNAKLIYTNKLYKNFNLTNEEKYKILESFDRAHSIRETKLAYVILAENLGATRSKKPSNRTNRKVKNLVEGAAKTVKSTKPDPKVINEGTEKKSDPFEVSRARNKKLAGIK